MPRYYGVKCTNCGLLIALASSAGRDGRNIQINFVPLAPIECPSCHHNQQYGAADGQDFDGPDGLL